MYPRSILIESQARTLSTSWIARQLGQVTREVADMFARTARLAVPSTHNNANETTFPPPHFVFAAQLDLSSQYLDR